MEKTTKERSRRAMWNKREWTRGNKSEKSNKIIWNILYGRAFIRWFDTYNFYYLFCSSCCCYCIRSPCHAIHAAFFLVVLFDSLNISNWCVRSFSCGLSDAGCLLIRQSMLNIHPFETIPTYWFAQKFMQLNFPGDFFSIHTELRCENTYTKQQPL